MDTPVTHSCVRPENTTCGLWAVRVPVRELSESKCNRWFHRACANISKADYTQLSKDSNKQWRCNRVDCVPLSEDPILVLTSSLNQLMNKIDSWSDNIKNR
ncbi:hypothetical protein J6590_048138 [Homalodisca vitripennis]|nr:hypothetical protein J6590_048138 [Homalodisca vitripennis]